MTRTCTAAARDASTAIAAAMTLELPEDTPRRRRRDHQVAVAIKPRVHQQTASVDAVNLQGGNHTLAHGLPQHRPFKPHIAPPVAHEDSAIGRYTRGHLPHLDHFTVAVGFRHFSR
jgi:hypothetical protein